MSNKAPPPDYDRLEKLRAAYKKVDPYQPLYGIDGFAEAQRGAKDRCDAIHAYFDNDVAGLRFLDVGCYFGYLTFYLADRGAQATGWDYWAPNIDVCNKAKDINGIAAAFELTELGPETIVTIKTNQFDVALILSVLHWTVHQKGLVYVQQCLAQLMQKVPIVIVELAQKGEGKDLLWDAAAPARDLDVFNLAGEITVEKIGEFQSRISENKRPLYVVSRRSVSPAPSRKRKRKPRRK